MEGHDDSAYYMATTNSYEIAVWYESLIANGSSHLAYADHPPFFHSAAIPDIYLTKLEEGVTCRAVYEAQSLVDLAKLDSAIACIEAGELARVIARCPFRMLIVDNSETLVIEEKPDSSVFAVRIRNPHIVNIFLRALMCFGKAAFGFLSVARFRQTRSSC